MNERSGLPRRICPCGAANEVGDKERSSGLRHTDSTNDAIFRTRIVGIYQPPAETFPREEAKKANFQFTEREEIRGGEIWSHPCKANLAIAKLEQRMRS